MTSKLTRGIERNQTRPFSEIDSGWCLRVDYKKTVANFAKLISKMNSGPRSASNRRKSKLSRNSPLNGTNVRIYSNFHQRVKVDMHPLYIDYKTKEKLDLNNSCSYLTEICTLGQISKGTILKIFSRFSFIKKSLRFHKTMHSKFNRFS